MFHFERSATFFWQTRVEGEGRLTVTCWEKASRQGKGTQPDVFTLLSAGTLGRRKPQGICAAVSQVAGSPVNPPPVRFLLSGWELGSWGRCAGPQADRGDPPSGPTGLVFGGGCSSAALGFLPYSLLPGRPPPLARMGWRQRKGLRES